MLKVGAIFYLSILRVVRVGNKICLFPQYSVQKLVFYIFLNKLLNA
jgi:hypothetical protein